jgi:hypothetical protein
MCLQNRLHGVRIMNRIPQPFVRSIVRMGLVGIDKKTAH